MAWVHAGLYCDDITTVSGAPAVSTPVTVTVADTGAPASLWADRDRSVALANPTSTSALGNLTFYADAGRYVCAANGGAFTITVAPDAVDIAELDASSKVPAARLPDLSGTYLTAAQRGAASGVAALDGAAKVPIGQVPTGASSTTVAAGNDARLSDARTPTAHAATHAGAGSDPVSPTSIGAAAASHTHGTADVTSGTLSSARLPNVVTLAVAPPTGVAATDTAAIQTALDAAYGAGGGLVQLQAGTYRIAAPGSPSSGGVRAQDNTTLAGMGIGVTVLKLADAVSTDVTGIIRTPSGVQNARVTFRDFTVDGNAANVTGTPTIDGFFCGVTPNSTQTDTDISCINVEIRQCRGYGFDPHERTTRLRLIYCISHDNGLDGAHDGFTLDGCYDSKVIGCIAYANGRHGINLVTASNGVEVVGCTAYGNTGNGLTLQNGTKHCLITGGHFHDNTGDGISINGVAQSSGQDLTVGADNRVTGALVERNGGHGIHLVGATRCHIAANTVRDSSQSATNTSHQIYLDESGTTYSTNNTITGNDLATTGLTNAPKYGITEKTSNDDNNLILGNRSAGAVTAQMLLAGVTSLRLAAHNGVNEHPATAVYVDGSPAEHGLLEWNGAPKMAGVSTAAIAAGIGNLAKIILQSGTGFSTVWINLRGTAPATLANTYLGVYDGAGNLLATSADQSSAWNATTGNKSASLGTTITRPAGTTLFVALLIGSAGTLPTLAGYSASGSALPNLGLGTSFANPARWGTFGSSLTALPSTMTIAATSATTFWCGLS